MNTMQVSRWGDVMARRGFTLIEILMVVVIIGILAALAIPKFSRSRSMTYSASIRSDLRTLSVAQEDYFLQYNSYAANPSLLNYLHSPGVTITVVQATTLGWSATGTHPMAYPITCAVYWGPVTPVSPATQEGQVDCQ